MPPSSAFPHDWLAALEAASDGALPASRRARFPKMASPDILEDLGVSLLRSGRTRPRERRSPGSAKEALPSAGLVHDKTWQRDKR